MKDTYTFLRLINNHWHTILFIILLLWVLGLVRDAVFDRMVERRDRIEAEALAAEARREATYQVCGYIPESHREEDSPREMHCARNVIQNYNSNVLMSDALRGLVQGTRISGTTINHNTRFLGPGLTTVEANFELEQITDGFFVGRVRYRDAWHPLCMAKDEHECIWYFNDGVVPEAGEQADGS